MFISRGTAEDILDKNVCELTFLRKRKKPGQNNYRRILCTRSLSFLNTPNGIKLLNFKMPPASPMKRAGMTYRPEAYPNLLMVWDIFMCDWRVINIQNCNLIWTIPTDEKFWEYYNNALLKMTTSQKIQFMDA